LQDTRCWGTLQDYKSIYNICFLYAYILLPMFGELKLFKAHFFSVQEIAELESQLADQASLCYDADARAHSSELTVADLEDKLRRFDDSLKQQELEHQQMKTDHRQVCTSSSSS